MRLDYHYHPGAMGFTGLWLKCGRTRLFSSPGGLAERSNAADLKSVSPQGLGGSNPSPSAKRYPVRPSTRAYSFDHFVPPKVCRRKALSDDACRAPKLVLRLPRTAVALSRIPCRMRGRARRI